MNIGFDAKRAFRNHTGLGNYSRSLLSSLFQFFPEHNYFLYSPSSPRNNQTEPLFQEGKSELRTAPWYIPDSLWRTRFIAGQAKQDHLDIYHGLSHELPIGLSSKNTKQVVTIHDLIFLRFPELYPAIDRRIYSAKINYACHHADKIIAISEQTKQDLIAFLNVPSEKISVIYQACSPTFKQICSHQAKVSVKEKYNLPESFLLQVGTIEARKNLLLSLQALTLLPEPIALVAVGKTTGYIDEINRYILEHQLGNRVKILPDIPFDDLPAIYQSAKIFLYPSRFEGFGIPILEALSSRVPVIAAKGSCLEEAGGPNSIYVSPDEPKQLAEAIFELLKHPEKGSKMKLAGLTYAKRFEPKILAHQLINLYEELVARGR